MAFDVEVALSLRYRELRAVLMKAGLSDLPILDCCLEDLCLAREGPETLAWVQSPRRLSHRFHPGPHDWVGYGERFLVPLPEVDLDVHSDRTQTFCLRMSRPREPRVGEVRRKLVMELAKVVGVEAGSENLFFVPDRGRMVVDEVARRA